MGPFITGGECQSFASLRLKQKGGRSVDHLLDFLLETVNARHETHVHELRLGVHLQAAENRLLDLELDDELLALVLGVRLQGSENLLLLVSGEAVGGDDGDLLLLVELLVELGVLLGDLLDEHEALVLGEDLDEAGGHVVEVAGLAQARIEGADLLAADAGVLRELLEALAVRVELADELHVLEHVVERALLGGGREENGRVAAWDRVLLRRGLVVGGRLNLLNVTKSEWLVKILVKSRSSVIFMRGMLVVGNFTT